MNARQAIERLGYRTVVRDLGEQRAAGKLVRERLLRAMAQSGRFVEGLLSVDALVASQFSKNFRLALDATRGEGQVLQ